MIKNILIQIIMRLMIIATGFSAQSCVLSWFAESLEEGKGFEVTISNQSNDPVYVRHCIDGQRYTPFDKYIYVAPGESYTEESIYWSSSIDDCVYQWLILKEETYEKYTEEELLDGAIFDDLIEYKYKRLKRMDFKVVYPVVYP